jgi:hypothetical protein
LNDNQQQPYQQPPRKKSHKVRNTFLGIGGAIVAIIVISVAASSGSSSSSTTDPALAAGASALASAEAHPYTPTADPEQVCQSSGGTWSGHTCTISAPASSPSPSPSPSSAPSTPSMTVAEQQAVDGAQQYLAMGSGFSYNSLLQQLTSSAGDGDTMADAKFAINYLNPDWDAQAVDAAKSYLQMGGFSRESLIQQLTSSAGDGFTYSQAEYAVNKVGL